MSALIETAPRGVHHHFQIIIRLQQLRARVSDLLRLERLTEPRLLDELRLTFRSLILAAQQAGFEAFTGLCRQAAGRVDQMIAGACVSHVFLTRVNEWAAGAELYVRRPQYRYFARSLVLQLKDPLWGLEMDDEHQAELIDRLTVPCW